jgi:hypothetical protein
MECCQTDTNRSSQRLVLLPISPKDKSTSMKWKQLARPEQLAMLRSRIQGGRDDSRAWSMLPGGWQEVDSGGMPKLGDLLSWGLAHSSPHLHSRGCPVQALLGRGFSPAPKAEKRVHHTPPGTASDRMNILPASQRCSIVTGGDRRSRVVALLTLRGFPWAALAVEGE